MKERNKVKKEFMDIPKVKKSVFEKIKNWFELKINNISDHKKSILKTVLSGVITSTAIAGTLITASMAFTIGLLPTLAVTSCYVAATMMSSYILREEVNKLKGNLVLKDVKKTIKNKDKDEETKLDIPEVKESKIEKVTKSLEEKFNKKKENNLKEKEEIKRDVPVVKESKIEKMTKMVKGKFNKKKEKLDIPEVKESRISKLFNPVKKIVNKIKPKKKKKKSFMSKAFTILSTISYGLLALVAGIGVAGVLGLNAIFGFGITALVTLVGSGICIGSVYKMYNNLVSLVVSEENEEEISIEDELEKELERTQNIIKNLNINSEANIDKAKLVEEEQLGKLKEEQEEIKLIEMNEILALPGEVEEVVEEPKQLSLSR